MMNCLRNFFRILYKDIPCSLGLNTFISYIILLFGFCKLFICYIRNIIVQLLWNIHGLLFWSFCSIWLFSFWIFSFWFFSFLIFSFWFFYFWLFCSFFFFSFWLCRILCILSELNKICLILFMWQLEKLS